MHDDLVKDVLARFAGRDYRPDGPPVWAWHVHHDILGEPLSAPIIARVQAIIDTKPSHEVVARLRALRPVLGVLPSAYVEAWKAYAEAGKAYAEAGKAYAEAGRVYVEAWKAYVEAGKAYAEAGKAYAEAGRVYVEAGRVYDEAWKVYDEAWKVYVEAGRVYDEAWKAYAQELSVIHDGECSECPWDGETMVFGTD